MSPRWELTELGSMPTLRQRPDADLKWDNGEIWVWLGRSSAADGGRKVIVEKRQPDGSWQ
jgi:hypothetical protein